MQFIECAQHLFDINLGQILQILSAECEHAVSVVSAGVGAAFTICIDVSVVESFSVKP